MKRSGGLWTVLELKDFRKRLKAPVRMFSQARDNA